MPEIPVPHRIREILAVRKTAPGWCVNTAEGLTTTTVEESKWP